MAVNPLHTARCDPTIKTRIPVGVRIGTTLLVIGIGFLFYACGIAYIVEEPVDLTRVFTGITGRLVDGESGNVVLQARISIRKDDSGVGTSSGQEYYVYSQKDGSFQVDQVAGSSGLAGLVPNARYILLFSSIDFRLVQFPILYEGGVQDLGMIELVPARLGGTVKPVVKGRVEQEIGMENRAVLRVGPPLP